MVALIDTNVLVRYFTFDPPSHGRQAAELIDGGEEVSVPSVAVAESAFVLTSYYRRSRAETVDALVGVLNRENVSVLELPKPLVIEALQLCRPSGRVSFADAFIWAAATHAGGARLYTFDQAFPGDKIDLRVLGRASETSETSQ